MKSVCIISLKFSPGLKKEFFAIGENFRKRGIKTNYIISHKYKFIEGDVEGIEYIKTRDSIWGLIKDTLDFFLIKKILITISSLKPLVVIFYNPHPLNIKIARLIKKELSESILCLYLHEPFTTNKSFYGFKKSIYIKIAEFMQGKSINYMNYIISPSKYSSDLFKIKYPCLKRKNIYAPLLIPDQKTVEKRERIYFSMVGNANKATGHDTFIELVNYSAEMNMTYKFCLITSSDIKVFLKKISKNSKKNLEIINKKMIKDSEINEIISQSYAVFRLDRILTQSGVIPVCYMNETPVIVRNIQGLTQHVWHKETGYIIPFNPSRENLIDAMEFIKNNFSQMSKNARQKYEEIWAEWNFEKYYGWLI